MILRFLKPEWGSDSAALSDGKLGKLTKKMKQVLTEMGYDPYERRAKPFTPFYLAWADRIFYMDGGNEKRLMEKIARFGPKAKAKCKRLSDYLPGEKRIPDPHFAKGIEEHRRVAKMIETALKNYIKATKDE